MGEDVFQTHTPLDDEVTRPSYYGGAEDPYEVVKVWRDLGMGPAAHFATCLKYLRRAGKKGDEEMKDLRKAEWYLTTAIDLGYDWTHRGEMAPGDVVEAWGCPEGLSDVVYLVLTNHHRGAAIGLQAYIVRREAELNE